MSSADRSSSEAFAAPRPSVAFELRGRRTTMTALRLTTTDSALIDAELAAKVAQAPAMFDGLPVVFEFDGLETPPRDGQLAEWCGLVRRQGLVPIGVGAGHGAEAEARALGLSVISEGRSATQRPRASEEAPTPAPEMPSPPVEGVEEEDAEPARAATRIVDQPIRSGQQVYARGGDLVVMAAVSPGAEILADGNIFVFGSLKGRALAGLHGDHAARIICRKLDAELVSIAGWYKTSEELEALEKRPKGTVQIRLEDEELKITPFEM